MTDNNLYECLICHNTFKIRRGLSTHIYQKHNINVKDYYDTFIEPNTIHICTCGKSLKFKNIFDGYFKHCSQSCAQSDINILDKKKQNSILKFGENNYNNRKKAKQTMIERYGVSNISQSEGFGEKVKQTKLKHFGDENYNNHTKIVETNLIRYRVKNSYQIDKVKEKAYKNNYNDEIYKKRNNTRYKILDTYEQENNCTRIGKLIEQYGQGWLSIKDNLTIYHFHGSTFIDNLSITKIEDYIENQTHGTSLLEKDILKFIKSIYTDEIIHRTKKIISPLELDIYLPKLNIAIEFNGTYWHSFENTGSKDCHLNKSILCRNKNVRLIHIYEFEDLDKQKQLLKDLILGQDNYPKNDFNKNNLIDNIPKSEIIYKDNKSTIYGAGFLF